MVCGGRKALKADGNIQSRRSSNLQVKQDSFLCSLPRAVSDHRVIPTWLFPRTFTNLSLTVLNGLRTKRLPKVFHYVFSFIYIKNTLSSCCVLRALSGKQKVVALSCPISYILFYFLSTSQTIPALLLTCAGAA